jgi:hypothetical protein
MTSETASGTHGRRLVDELRWGVSTAVVVTALTFVPALLVFLVSGAVLDSRERLTFLRMASAYLGLAIAAGLVLGWGRRFAARSRFGAACLGAWIGAQSLVLGMVLADPRHRSETGLLVVSAGIGAVVGAPMGLWFRARAAVWQERRSRIERAT